MPYSKEIKKYLLTLARETIMGRQIEKKYIEELKEKLGVFVTLEKNETLRGCIGYVEGVKSVYESVIEMSLSAAFKDPRFPAVSKNEMPNIRISITIL